MTMKKSPHGFSRCSKLLLLNLVTIIAGCAVTDQDLRNPIEQTKDLDYYLGHNKLKDGDQPPPGVQFVPNGMMAVSLDSSANFYAANPAFACLTQDDPRFSYRKKVGFLALNIDHPQYIVDLGDIQKRLPVQLSKRFNRDSFVVIDATGERLPITDSTSPQDRQSLIRHFAKKYNVQFVVTGTITNTEFLTNSATRKNSLINSITGTSLEQERQMEMSLAVYDGTTGSLIDESLYQGSANDRVSMLTRDSAFGSQYKAGSYAHLLDTYLNHQSLWLEEALTCLPMQARVTSVTGEGITFATGTESLLLPGDRLKLMRRIQMQQTLDGQPQYRFEENGQVVVSQVYPNGALALFDGSTPPYQVNQGDIVQAW
ncbi:flagella assembly protein FlgT middle domain-containing protein [Halioxenophilus sp. WMMB6]|uniref:flagella assembly protein FlgT middle domain-containing protein n=1 Tax=Halioxenophilus sp. WMMB6 TaxID=3073815 RepID=UPI00295EA3CE|nr:flagella assembly protein FlgT middle domain-containing protein [Halioxenophilus sp. WMMB6]